MRRRHRPVLLDSHVAHGLPHPTPGDLPGLAAWSVEACGQPPTPRGPRRNRLACGGPVSCGKPTRHGFDVRGCQPTELVAEVRGTLLGSETEVTTAHGRRWQYPLIGTVVVANALLAFQGQAELTPWKLILGALWLAAAGYLGWCFAGREEKLTAQCELDGPTGMFNRGHFELCFKRSLAITARHRQPLALFVIDVDGLKSINDRLGHRAGDAAIKLVADALRKGCRAGDVAARWGGDEFVLLAPHTNSHQAETLARRITAAVRAEAATNSAEARVRGTPSAPWVTVSVGYAIAQPQKASSLVAATLFAEADQAMYRRKATRAAPTARLDLHRDRVPGREQSELKEREQG